MESKILGADELKRKFAALGEAVQEKHLVAATLSGGLVILNAAIENIKAQNLIRTRTLSRSITEVVAEQQPARVAVDIGTNLEYAPTHEYGGTIRAKQGKYLAIPLTKAARAAGSPRSFGIPLRLRRGGSGNLVLVDANGQAQYVLKQSVTIPARPYLRPAFDDKHGEAQAQIGASLLRLIEQVENA
jgi:phage gpG-like protein